MAYRRRHFLHTLTGEVSTFSSCAALQSRKQRRQQHGSVTWTRRAGTEGEDREMGDGGEDTDKLDKESDGETQTAGGTHGL